MTDNIDIGTKEIDEYEHQLVLKEPTEHRDEGDVVWGGMIHPDDVPEIDGESMKERIESMHAPAKYVHNEQ